MTVQPAVQSKGDANAEKFKRPDPWADPKGWVEWWRDIVGFPQVEAIQWLREEARKSWQYAISDELVHSVEVSMGERPGTSYIEHYLRGEWWLEVLLRVSTLGYEADYIAIIERAGNKKILALDPDKQLVGGASWHDLSVLINDVGDMEKPEKVRICIVPSVVRLQRLDLVLRSRRDFLDSWQSPGVELADVLVDWKLNPPLFVRRQCGVIDESELKSEMIKARPHIVNRIAEDDAQSYRGFFMNLPPKYLASGAIRVYIADERVGLAGIVGGDFCCEIIEMFLRPFTLEPWSIERRHEVYSHHEQRQDRPAQTEDLKGPRNPHPQAQGRRRRHREVGEVQAALNSAPPEEVAPQTSPACGLGDCTATRTRSGSPEDA